MVTRELSWKVGFQETAEKLPDQWIPATVPGAVQLDFAEAYHYKPYTYANEYRQFDWMEDVYFRYRTTLPEEIAPGDDVDFVLEGVDYQYSVFVDNREVLAHTGMFSPVRVSLQKHLKRRGAQLEVLVYPTPKIPGRPADRSQAAQSCKSPVGYGWDFHPRLIPCGIWKDAYLVYNDTSYIVDVDFAASVSEELDYGTVEGTVQLHATGEEALRWELLDADGCSVADGRAKAAESVRLSVPLNKPRLWWPNGHGDAYLYTLRLTLEHNGVPIHTLERRCGFKRIELVLDPGAGEGQMYPKGRVHAPITVKINGKRIFAKGTNWVCPTVFPGTLTEKQYREQLLLIRDAHMNMVRCWGGAVVNKDDFFDICDEYGIMIWQEFPLACNNYVGTPEYLALLDQESKAIIRQLRRHPCHCIWCGGNELFNTWSGMTDQSPALRLLNRNCYDLDGSKPFLMTAPLMGMGHGGYCFWSPQGEDLFIQINRAAYTAYSEFGCPSGATWETLQATFPPEQLEQLGVGDCWITHNAVNALTPTSWLEYQRIQSLFPEAREISRVLELSRELQAIGYQYFFEEARRQWPRCSMAMNWCFNEPYPNAANNAVIGFPLQGTLDVKPAYAAIRQALRPTLLTARIPRFDHPVNGELPVELWLVTEQPVALAGTIHLTVTDSQGTACETTVCPDRHTAEDTEKLAELVLRLPAQPGWVTLALTWEEHPEWNTTYRLLARKQENGLD